MTNTSIQRCTEYSAGMSRRLPDMPAVTRAVYK